MANKQIEEFPLVDTPDDLDIVHISRGGADRSITVSDLIPSVGTSGTVIVNTFKDGVEFTAGSSNAVSISEDIISKRNIWIFFDSLYQEKETYEVVSGVVTFDAVIPVGVSTIEILIPKVLPLNVTTSSDNVEFVEGESVEDVLSATVVFNTVQEMIDADWLQVGWTCRTLGYNIIGDGGGNDYQIVAAATGTDDGGSFIDLSGSGLQARGLFPLGFTSPKQWGAVGDGVADDTVPVSNWQAFTGIQLSPSGDYNTPGSVGASGSTRVLIADNTSESGSDIPYLTIADEPFKTLPKNHVFVQQDTANRSDAVCVQIQRIVSTDDGNTNPKALRAITVVNDGTGGNQVEHAISGEVENSDNSGTAVEGGTSISGVSLKKAAGTGVMFGGHFQVKDETDAATVGGIVGVECNIQANGPDTNSNRIGFDLIARTYEPGTLAGEFSAGLRIRNSSTIDGGKWTNAILIQDGVQTTPQAITIENSPGTIIGYGIEDSGQKARGIDLQGQYGIAAIDAKNSNLTTSDVVIRLKDKGKIQFDDASNSFIKWDSAVNSGGGSLVLGGQSTQTTVGAAGAASALPANPTGYLNLNINGADFVLPFYNQA